MPAYTQQEVAQRLGRPQSFVAKYEGGERRLDVIEFIAVTEVLGRGPGRGPGGARPLVSAFDFAGIFCPAAKLSRAPT